MTLVWKADCGGQNLTKLATTCGQELLTATEKDSTASPISVAGVYDALLTSVATTSQSLRRRRRDTPLKPLRVFLRALQGHFLALAESLTAQVETSLVVVLDAVAALLSLGEWPDAQRQTQLVVTWIESLATSPQLQRSTKLYAATFLAQPVDEMLTLVMRVRRQLMARSC
ncbi:hypothetical protein ATCC90586_011302 [Pythium insidiosum]|nr:hypothetical protein ATCC90586_011302 [Pythium insidiosum]